MSIVNSSRIVLGFFHLLSGSGAIYFSSEVTIATVHASRRIVVVVVQRRSFTSI